MKLAQCLHGNKTKPEGTVRIFILIFSNKHGGKK